MKSRFTVLEFVSDKVDLVHDGVSCSDVLLLLSHWALHLLHGSHSLFWSKDDVAGPEVVVDDPVGVTLPADADALKHTVASQLVHNLGEERFEKETPEDMQIQLTKKGSTSPGFLWLLGTMQRMKDGSVDINMLIKLFS